MSCPLRSQLPTESDAEKQSQLHVLSRPAGVLSKTNSSDQERSQEGSSYTWRRRLGDSGDASSSGRQCPLGFGTDAGPKFSMLHCQLCRCLFHDCVQVEACGHRYCRFCILRFQDCPTCGVDIKGVKDDPETQGLVDKYIDAHCGNHTMWEVDSGEPVEKVDDPTGLDRCASTFFLQLGLRSYMRGNLDAARVRLQRCETELLKQLRLENGSSKKEARLCCQLGAVCGSLGDCCKRLGDMDAAVHHYHDSVNHLRQVAGDEEALRELSVSLNKLGDAYFYGKDIEAARERYAEGLDLRRKMLQRKKNNPNQVLEVAVSLVKVADADQALGREKAARKLFLEAKRLVESLRRHVNQLDPGRVTMYESLGAFLVGKVKSK